MPGTFFGINTALRGLEAQQTGLNVTGHNIANASTQGYSRQEVDLQASDPIDLPGNAAGQLGSGVDVADVKRAHDSFIQQQIIYQNGSQSSQQSLSDTLAQVSDVYNAPSAQGFGSLLSSYFTAWQGLANNPSDTPSRSVVIAQGTALATGFNAASSALTALQTNEDGKIAPLVTQVNTIAQSIATLNGQITAVSATGQSPNDLQDKRDALVNQLSQIVGIQYNETPQGAANISLRGGGSLVQGVTSFALSTAADASRPNVTDILDQNGRPVTVSDGQLGGAITARDKTIQGQLDSLNTLASNVMSAVNAFHIANYDANGKPGEVFFTGTSAASMSVNPDVAADPAKVAAAGSAPTGKPSPEDGSGALSIAQLQEKPATGQAATVQAQYAGTISALGVAAQQANVNADTGGLVLQHLQAQQSSVSGVSLNEEASNLLQYQQAYAASARVISMMDQTISDMIQQLGR